MKKFKISLAGKSAAILLLLLLCLVSLIVPGCSKDSVNEDDDEEKFTITYRIMEYSGGPEPDILEVSYTDAKGDKVATDYAGFGLGKEVRVTKPFDATLSVKAHNPSTTEFAEILLQISVGLEEVEAVEFFIEPNTTLTHEAKHRLR